MREKLNSTIYPDKMESFARISGSKGKTIRIVSQGWSSTPFSCILVRSKEAHGTQNKKYYSYDGRNRNDGVDTLIDEFIRECEREGSKT